MARRIRPGRGAASSRSSHDPRVEVYVVVHPRRAESRARSRRIRHQKTLRLDPIGVDLGSRNGQDGLSIADADIFVGIYWQSFGWESDLEREYEASSGLPGLVYVKEPAPEREDGLTQLLERVRNDARSKTRTFESPGELAEMLVEDLAGVMSERFAKSQPDHDSLPVGTLTFMFGDLAGSTTLVEQLGDRYAEVLAGYHQVVAEATLRHDGTVVDLEGERLFSVFQDAFQAVSATVEIQKSLGDRSWPELVSVSARLGLHTGTARIGSGGYVGLDVHRASRVASSAHGGQIVVSAPVRELVEGQTEHAGWEIKDLGSFALKGLSRVEKLFQVRAPGLRADFPPPRARSITRVRLPASQNTLVGRSRELAELIEMLQRPNVRLATIVGPGGIGKTRLALSVAEDSSAEFPDGVYFVNLAAITDPGHVLLAIGAAAGIPIEGDAIDALSSEFQDQQVLLVIDNFEHVAEGGSSVADLLGRSPGLKVLATSRVPLRIMSEYEYTLEPLGLPATGSDRPESVSASDAVRLFIDRALAVIPGFSIDEETRRPWPRSFASSTGCPWPSNWRRHVFACSARGRCPRGSPNLSTPSAPGRPMYPVGNGLSTPPSTGAISC